MLILIARILALIFAGLIISKSVLSFMQRKENWVMTLFWVLTWGAIVALAFWPSLVTKLTDETQTGIGTITGIGLIFIYFVVYRVYVKVDRVEKDMQKLIRDIAVKDADKK
jgi:hypothetical protein